MNDWRKKNPEKWKEIQNRGYLKRKERYHSDPEFRAKLNNRWKISYQKRRMTCLIHYGGNPPRCACCTENRIEFLTIDHINGGGTKHQKQWKSEGYGSIFSYLVRNKFPEGFRILCYNCNQSIGHYGYCPHEKEKD